MIDADRFRTAILVVGFRNPQDVCACTNALSRMGGEQPFDVFVCENGGGDWFDELHKSLVSPQGPCVATTGPSLFLTPIPGGHLIDVVCLALKGRRSRVFIGRAAQNLGYAGGINAWISRLLPSAAWTGFCILNPDAEPEPDALDALVKRSITGNKGMVGSTILPAKGQNRIHCRGGHHWRKFRTNTTIIGFGEQLTEPVDLPTIEAALDCVSGASMYVTRKCVEEIGLMDERFFLYYEDADWSMRAKEHGLGYAPNSIVRHAGGTTIGSARLRAERSSLSVYLTSRNRIHFVRLYWRTFLPLAYVFGLVHAATYLFARSPKNCIAALDGLFAAIRGETGPPPKVEDKDHEKDDGRHLYMERPRFCEVRINVNLIIKLGSA